MPTPPPTDAPQPSQRRSTTSPARQAAEAAAAPDAPAQDAPTPEPPVDDLSGLSYEQARDELVAVVARLEAGGASLEESLVLWERGEALAARCQEWLDGARTRLDHARGDSPAGPSTASTETPQQGEPR